MLDRECRKMSVGDEVAGGAERLEQVAHESEVTVAGAEVCDAAPTTVVR